MNVNQTQDVELPSVRDSDLFPLARAPSTSSAVASATGFKGTQLRLWLKAPASLDPKESMVLTSSHEHHPLSYQDY